MAKQTSYEEKCAIMEEYYQNSSEKIKAKTVYKEYPIGNWQANLRASDRRGQLHIVDSLRKRFEKIGVIAPRERKKPISMMHKYETLLRFRKNFPTLKITHKTVDENGEPIGVYREDLQIMYDVDKLRLSKEEIQELKDAGILNKSIEEVKNLAEKYHITPTQVKKIEYFFGDIEKFMKDYKSGNISLSMEQMNEFGIEDFIIVALSSRPISVREKSSLIKMLLSTKEINPAQELDNKGRFINVDYIYELLNRLPTQDRKIVELFYGINGRQKTSRIDITNQLHVARETINKKIERFSRYLSINYPEIQTKNSLNAEQIKASLDLSQERKTAEEQLERLILDYETVLRQEYKTLTNKYNKGISDETQISVCTYLSTRARNSLMKAGISTIGQARRLTLEKVAALPNCGEKTFIELCDKLELKLRDQIAILQQLLEEIEKKKQELQLKIAGITDIQKQEGNRIDNINSVLEEYDSAFSRFVSEENIFSRDAQIQPTGNAHNKLFDAKILNSVSQDARGEQQVEKTPLAQKKQKKIKITKEYRSLQKALKGQSDKQEMLEDILRKYGIIVLDKKENR